MTQPKVPEYEVEADNGLGLRGLAAVEDGRLGLCPDEATAVCQETVVAGAHLTLGQHYTRDRDTDRKEMATKGWTPCTHTKCQTIAALARPKL